MKMASIPESEAFGISLGEIKIASGGGIGALLGTLHFDDIDDIDFSLASIDRDRMRIAIASNRIRIDVIVVSRRA